MSATVYLLERNGELLARMSLRSDLEEGSFCVFEPTAAFEVHRPVFDEYSQVLDALDERWPPSAELAARDRVLNQQIRDLGLTIREQDGQDQPVQIELLIIGDQAVFRPLDEHRGA